MPNTQKLEQVEKLRKKISKAKSIIVVDYQGLKANDITSLRLKLGESNSELSVGKNTLLQIAMKEEKKDLNDISKHLDGPTAVVFSYNDFISPIKILVEFAKKLELPKIKAGLIDNKFLNVDQINILSKLPSREVLLAQVVGGIKSPIVNFVHVLSGSKNKLVYVLAAIAKKREEVS